MEEQQELLSLERASRFRRVRAVVAVVVALGGLFGAACMIASRPAPPHMECREYRREHEVFLYPGGRIQRPADTWTTCEWH